MLISIDPTDSRPIYIQIVDEVRRGIVTGTIVANASLPSVRQLAAELRVNPNTVQQAYRELERAALVYVRRGQGTFIAESAPDGAERERILLARSVAKRALTDAYRHGVNADQLIDAMREIQNDKD